MPRNETAQNQYYIAHEGSLGHLVEVGPNLVVDTGLSSLDVYPNKGLAMVELAQSFPQELARVLVEDP